MATLSIVGQPTGIVPAYAPLEFKARVSPTGASESVSIYLYEYGNPNILAQWSQKKDLGNTDIFTFRAEQIIQDYLGYDLQPTSAYGIVEAPNSIIQVFSIISDNTNNSGLFGNLFYAINACAQPGEETSWPEYVMDGSRTKKFLTHAPSGKEVRLGEHEMMSFITTATSSVCIRLRKYYGGVLSPTTVEKGISSPLLAKKRLDLGVGPRNIHRLQPGFIDSLVSHYEVSLLSTQNQNFFPDADNGKVEAHMNGLLNGPYNTSSSHSTHVARTGTHSAKFNFSNGNAGYHTGFTAATVLPLAPNTQYTFSCYVYCEGVLSTTNPPAMRINVQGLTDANVIFQNTWQAGSTNRWLYLRTMVTTGNDTAGKFVLEKTGNWTGVAAYFDDFNINGRRAYSEVRRFTLVPSCPQGTRVHFLNRMGGMDSYTFAGAERRQLRTEGSTFEKIRPSWGATKATRGRQVLQKGGTVKISCSTDALRPEEALWLEELLTSTAVYVQEGEEMIAVTLKDGEFETLDPAKNIMKLRVELEYAADVTVQRN